MTVGGWIYKNLIPATIGTHCLGGAPALGGGDGCEAADVRLRAIPATLDPPGGHLRPLAGNWIGGAILVGLLSSGLHGRPGRRMSEAWQQAAERVTPAVARCCGASRPCSACACAGRRHIEGDVEGHAR